MNPSEPKRAGRLAELCANALRVLEGLGLLTNGPRNTVALGLAKALQRELRRLPDPLPAHETARRVLVDGVVGRVLAILPSRTLVDLGNGDIRQVRGALRTLPEPPSAVKVGDRISHWCPGKNRGEIWGVVSEVDGNCLRVGDCRCVLLDEVLEHEAAL